MLETRVKWDAKPLQYYGWFGKIQDAYIYGQCAQIYTDSSGI